jgi:hypothetical protein
MPKQTQTRHAPPYKQLEVKAIPTSFLCGNRNGHHNTEFRNIKTHNRTTQKFEEMNINLNTSQQLYIDDGKVIFWTELSC